jgi:hypothetical protein
LHIKQSSETYPLNGGGLRFERTTNSNHWDIGTDEGDWLEIAYNGVSKGTFNTLNGTYSPVSDIRMKKDIENIGTMMPAIMQLRAKTYHYKDNEKDAMLSYGFIAQDVEKLFPEFVSVTGPDKMRTLAYQNFSVIAIKALQEQQEQIEQLKAAQKEMQTNQQLIKEDQNNRIAKLEKQLEQLLKIKNN